MTRIFEIVDDVERQLVPIRKPLDHWACAARDSLNDSLIGTTLCLALDVAGETLRRVLDPFDALKPRPGRRDETG
jgi:hypothetical protein